MVNNMTNTHKESPVRSIAKSIIGFPKAYVSLSLLMLIALLTALPQLYKDTRSDAFLAKDNPALVYKDKVKALFGLSDPIVIAVTNTSKNGVFNPASLKLVNWLSEEISSLDNINSDRVTSLATENNITGSEEGMAVDPFFDDLPDTQEKADLVWAGVSDFPLYMGNLVAKDKQATLIVAELLDEAQVEDTYQKILSLIEKAPQSASDKIYVAGEGAIAGYLGSYIDADAQRLNPLAGIVITIIILFAFRRASPGILSNVIIAASVLMTLAIMALNDVPFFVITNALPVILIGISVADSIHVYSHYFELQAKHPEQEKSELLIQTLEAMWRPITLTTLTTIAGFLGLYFAAYMPPFKYFGLYTAIGVAIAWIYSLVFLPAALAIIKPSASKQMVSLSKSNKVDIFARVMMTMGRVTLNKPKITIGIFSFIIISGLFAASHLTVNEDRIETFHHDEALYKADKAINEHFNGTNTLDVVIETNKAEALFKPENLAKMEALQTFALSLENVQGATSIVDYLKQMNRSLNGNKPSAYVIPDDADLISQYFLLYSASGDPTDFEEEIDYDYRNALVRVRMDSARYQQDKVVVEETQKYLDYVFNTGDMKATLSGRVNVDYHWLDTLLGTQYKSILFSLFFVWIIVCISLRSLYGGSLAVIPVLLGCLSVYAFMGAVGITLAVGTSMTAAIALGIGVDFSIHTLDRIKLLIKEEGFEPEAALRQLYPSTGRALLFSFFAVFIGFGILGLSYVPPLSKLGMLVAFSVLISFVSSMTVLPALIKHLKPAFLGYPKKCQHCAALEAIKQP